MSCYIHCIVRCYIMSGIIVCMLFHSDVVVHTHKLQLLALSELARYQDSDVMSDGQY